MTSLRRLCADDSPGGKGNPSSPRSASPALLPVSFFGIAAGSPEIDRDVIVEAAIVIETGQFDYRIKSAVDNAVTLRVVNRDRAQLPIIGNDDTIPRKPYLSAAKRIRFLGGLSRRKRASVNCNEAHGERFLKFTSPSLIQKIFRGLFCVSQLLAG